MKNILLLGGTGAIGEYVVKNCVDKGFNVFITSRQKRSNQSKYINYFQGDAKDYDFVKSVVTKNKFSAIVDFMVYKTEEFNKNLKILTSYTDHYIFLSSYRIYNDLGLIALREDSPRLLDSSEDKYYISTDEYAISKARQENLLRTLREVNWTIVRPSITYSSGRFQLGNLEANTILSRANKGIPIILPQEIMEVKTTLTWAGDAGKMISELILDNDVYGEVYNVSTSESVKWKEIAKIYKDVINLKIKIVPIVKYKTLNLNPYQLQYDRLFNRVCDNNKIMKLKGLKSYNCKSVWEGIPEELERTDLSKWSNTYSRIHGRMDRLINVNRLNEIAGLRGRLNYYVGYNNLTNYLLGVINKRKFI